MNLVTAVIVEGSFEQAKEDKEVAKQYNNQKVEQGPRLFWYLIVKRATVQGFLVTDYLVRFREGMEGLAAAYQDGALKYRESITDGLEAAPRAFIEMMRGANIGKQLVRIRAED